MSWDMWHCYGKGFSFDKVNPKKYKEFVSRHVNSIPDTFPNREAVLDAVNQLYDSDDEFDCVVFEPVRDATDSWSIAEPIAEIMKNETGLVFEAYSMDDNNSEYVMFCPAYPWNYNGLEKTLTEDVLDTVLKRYMEELGIPLEEVGSDYSCDAVYSG